METSYIISNKTKESFTLAEALISTMFVNRKIRKLNNFDGTFDYIILCTIEEAEQLRQEGLHLISDRPITFEKTGT